MQFRVTHSTYQVPTSYKTFHEIKPWGDDKNITEAEGSGESLERAEADFISSLIRILEQDLSMDLERDKVQLIYMSEKEKKS